MEAATRPPCCPASHAPAPHAAWHLRPWVAQALLLLVGIFWAVTVLAQEVLPVPALSARVIDQTGTLDAAQKASLEAKLAAFEARKGPQVVLLLVPTTQPEDIASYANRIGNAWKVGRKDVGDGVLLLVAKNDRQVRIEVAKTLEGALPDLAARRIIDEAITPRFRSGDFAGGLDAAVDQIMARLAGEPLPAPAAGRRAPAGQPLQGDWSNLLLFMVFALPIGATVLRGMLGRKMGAVATGAAAGGMAAFFGAGVVIAVLAGLAGLVFGLVGGLGSVLGGRRGGGFGGPMGGWGAGGGGGGGWGGGGGGGFRSGGGGDFGGGGASGRW